MGAVPAALGVWNSRLGTTLLPDPCVDLVAIKPPFIEDFFCGYPPLPGKPVKRSLTNLQVLRELFNGHDRTGHSTLSSHSIAVERG